MTADDRYKVALNIVARVGMSGDIIGEYSKAMAGIHSMSSQEQMANMQNMTQSAPQPQNQPPQGTIPLDMGNNATQDPNALNQPPQPTEAGKYDSL